MKCCLTDGFLNSISVDSGKRLEVIDSAQKGLVLRVSPKSAKSWAFLYRRTGDQKRRRVTLGRYPEIGLIDARDSARRLQADIERGHDPAGNHSAGRDGLTFGLFAEEYVEQHAMRHKRSWTRDRAILKRDVVPSIGHKRLSEIDRGDVRNILDSIEARGAPVQACRVLEVIRKAFNFAIHRNHLSVNPCSGMVMAMPAGQRDRNLAPEEINRFWDQLAQANMAWSTQQILRVCLVTAQGVGDVSGARKDEISFDDAVWEISSSRTRNRVAHRVPLSPLAVKLFSDAVRRSGEGDFVFPGKSAGNAMTANAVSRAMQRNLNFLELEDLTPQDLQRTAVAGMRELGIARMTIAKVLNHISKDRTVSVQDHDKHEFEREKRITLESWTARLQEFTGTARVTRQALSPWR